jgi:hypothetical protein
MEGTDVLLQQVIENQNEMIQCLTDVNTSLQYQANQFYVLLVGLVLVFVTYMMYRVVKNFY